MVTQRLASGSDILTFQDIVEHILDMFENSRSGRPLRIARRAVRESLRELYGITKWQYFTTTHYFKTKAEQTSGTIEYTHSTRTVTLTGSTWPSDVVQRKIIIDSSHYTIESRTDSTNIVLHEGENPGEDVSSGTSYTLYKESYTLPHGIAAMGSLIDLDSNWRIPVIQSNEQLARKHLVYETPDTPWKVSIRNNGVLLNDMSLVFSPPPDSEIPYIFTYQRKPRNLKVELYDTGKASASDGSTSVSFGSGVSLDSSHVGCVIRFGSAINPPTPIAGSLDGVDNPFTDQAIILSQSGDSCTIDTAVSQTYSDVNFTISDPVDIDNVVMLSAFQRMCEAKYARLTKREEKEVQQLEQSAMFALRQAKEGNNRTSTMPMDVYHDSFRNVNVITDDS